MEIIIPIIIGIYIYKKYKYKKMTKEKQSEIHQENLKRYKEERMIENTPKITIEIKETLKRLIDIKPVKEEKNTIKKRRI